MPLAGWPAEVIGRYLAAHPELGPDDLLCVTAATAPARRTRSVLNQLCRVLRNAGFAGHPDVSGRSLRLTAARAVFDRDNNIEEAARFLGSPSLDNTAAAIGWNWSEHDDGEPLGANRDPAAESPIARNGRDSAAEIGPSAHNGRDSAAEPPFAHNGNGDGDD